MKALRSVGAGQYKLARTTAYVKPGTSHGTQGTRILYDTNKYRLVSNCPETTGKSNYNGSCSMDMPIMSSDSKSKPPQRGVRRVRRSQDRQELLRRLGPPRRSAQRQPQQGEGPRLPARRPGPRRLQQGERPRRRQADPLRWRHQLLEDQGRQPRAVQLPDEPGLRGRHRRPEPDRRAVPDGQPLEDDPQGERRRVARSLSTSSW